MAEDTQVPAKKADTVTADDVMAPVKPGAALDAEKQEQEAAETRRQAEAQKSQRRIRAQSRATVIAKLLRTRARYGGKHVAMVEPEGRELTYDDVLRGAFALGSWIRRHTKRGEKVGIMMPTSAGGIIAFLAVQVHGRVPAMLNFTAGTRNLFSALRTGEISKVITAHKFIEIAELHGLIDELKAKAAIWYLEDMREQLSAMDKAQAVLGPRFPGIMRRPVSPDSPGVILFTSGTEGQPKGVVLSHQNLVANVEQIREHVSLEEWDIVFNPLPIFHCYGLTAGSLFPLLDGKKLVPYPSPLHVKLVPEVIRKTKATIVFATDTFLHRYLRSAREDALSTVRYAVCGAEHVRDETRALARSRFGFNVIEGYGMTEAAPVVAANQPGDIRPGTVGKLLPGIETRLEPVSGMSEGGRLLVRGPNVMLGYLKHDKPGEIEALTDGWHDTGDIVHIDGGGYMSIRGRVKRFAKLGGEMVSLAVVENCASVVWPDFLHAAVALPDDKKGEQIILMTECQDPDRSRLLSWAQSHGVPELAVPKKIISVDDIPVLGTGKVDYMQLEAIARKKMAPTDEKA
ncbi:AMP-binding protein [Aquisalinus flavus]|uniref:Acyl-ACP synthetase n=1 Tax=Aquisalinus flavus TaxID=1526572 RepID=A0A8J2V579_9PROT|nr:AMP-binding protein [Aquisalinus flavus]GGD17343.1 acyl-ACP synthetase [Aquisalinus flavus]